MKAARALGVVVGLAIALRLGSLLAFPPSGLVGDESAYVRLAMRSASFGAWPDAARAPGYVWFLGALWRLPGDPFTVARLCQIALAAFSILVLHAIGREALGERAALLAASLFAIDPTMIAYTHYLHNETLYVLLLLLAALSWLKAWSSRDRWAALATGALLGAATLVKSSTIPHALLLFVCAAVWATADRLERAASMAFAWAIVVLSYSIAASSVHGRFVLVDDSAGRTLWDGNRLDYKPAYGWSFGGDATRVRETERRLGILGPSRESAAPPRALLTQELRFVASDPLRVLRRMPEKIAALWNPTSFLQRRIAFGRMDGVPPGSRRAAVVGVLATVIYGVTLAAAVLGLWHARGTGLELFALSMLASYLAVYGVMASQSRYRLPLMPFLFLYAGQALAGAAPLRPWRTLGALLTALALLASWTPYWPLVLP